ncbi:MAG: FAD-dependent oxidoreductase [Clostridia bacterium]|nr:FAD-dependent oxidoreductase [Clostridia bacterium]
MNSKYEVLFEPMKIGNLKLKNRFVLEPMEGTNIVEGMGKAKYNEKVHDYYIERAKNDVGLIIPGMILLKSMIGSKWAYKQEKEFLKAKPLIDEIHQYGSKVFFQIGCGWGRAFTMQSMMRKMYDNRFLKVLAKPLFNFNDLLVAPSKLPNRWMPDVEHREITKEEIHEFIEAYAKTAKLCKEAGVDGVEVHAVHEGYLLDQFTTKYTNQRTDEYGGSFENRYRFAVEVVQAIKKECGVDYPVSIRFSVTSKTKGFEHGAVPGEEYVEVGRDLEEGMKAAKYLQDAGYDMLNADNGTYDAWFWAHPPVYMPLNCNLKEAEKIKEVVNIPVVCAGRMQPEEAARSISEGKLDGIGIARQFLTDPEYITKIKENRLEDVLPCIACHNVCLPTYHYKGVGCEVEMSDLPNQGHCALNPRTFNEKKYEIKKVENPKNIAIIGAGIAGLTAAIQLVKRGHQVVVYEKSDELCGVFNAAATPSFKEKDKQLIQWYKRQVKLLNIDVKFNSEITDLSTIKTDEIIIATGAKPRLLKVAEGKDTVEAIEYLREYKSVGDKVAIIGGGLSGCEIAYDLALKGKHPMVIEMEDDILKTKGLCMANSSCLRELLSFHDVPVYTETSLKEIKSGSIVVDSKDGEKEFKVDSVITSCGYISGTTLVDEETLKKNKNIHLLGDVDKVGNLKNVIWSAYELAFSL